VDKRKKREKLMAASFRQRECREPEKKTFGEEDPQTSLHPEKGAFSGKVFFTEKEGVGKRASWKVWEGGGDSRGRKPVLRIEENSISTREKGEKNKVDTFRPTETKKDKRGGAVQGRS